MRRFVTRKECDGVVKQVSAYAAEHTVFGCVDNGTIVRWDLETGAVWQAKMCVRTRSPPALLSDAGIDEGAGTNTSGAEQLEEVKDSELEELDEVKHQKAGAENQEFRGFTTIAVTATHVYCGTTDGYVLVLHRDKVPQSPSTEDTGKQPQQPDTTTSGTTTTLRLSPRSPREFGPQQDVDACQVLRVPGGGDAITSMAVSNTEERVEVRQQLAVGLQSGKVYAWTLNASTGEIADGCAARPVEYGGHKHPVRGLCFSRDGTRLASGSGHGMIAQPGQVRIHNIETGRCETVVPSDIVGAVSSACFLEPQPGWSLVACGSDDTTVHIVDSVTGQRTRRLIGHTAWVNDVQPGANDWMVVSASGNPFTAINPAEVKLWSITSGLCLRTVPAPVSINSIEHLWCSKVEDRMVTVSDSGALHFFDFDVEECVSAISVHSNWVRALAISDTVLVSGSRDGTAAVFGIPDPDAVRDDVLLQPDWRLRTRFGTKGGAFMNAVCVHGPTNSECATVATSDGWARTFDTANGASVKDYGPHPAAVFAVVVAQSGRVITGCDDNNIYVWHGDTGELVRKVEGHASNVRSLAIHDACGLLCSGSADATIKVWSLQEDFALVQTLQGHTFWVNSLVFCSKGRRLVSGSGDKTIRVWNIGSLSHQLQQHQQQQRSRDSISGEPAKNGHGHAQGFGPNTRASGIHSRHHCPTEMLAELDICERVLEGHEAYVVTVAIGGDDAYCASASTDATCRLWDMDLGICVRVIVGHAGPVLSVVFSRNDEFLVTGGSDAILLWDMDRFCQQPSAPMTRRLFRYDMQHANTDSVNKHTPKTLSATTPGGGRRRGHHGSGERDARWPALSLVACMYPGILLQTYPRRSGGRGSTHLAGSSESIVSPRGPAQKHTASTSGGSTTLDMNSVSLHSPSNQDTTISSSRQVGDGTNRAVTNLLLDALPANAATLWQRFLPTAPELVLSRVTRQTLLARALEQQDFDAVRTVLDCFLTLNNNPSAGDDRFALWHPCDQIHISILAQVAQVFPRLFFQFMRDLQLAPAHRMVLHDCSRRIIAEGHSWLQGDQARASPGFWAQQQGTMRRFPAFEFMRIFREIVQKLCGSRRVRPTVFEDNGLKGKGASSTLSSSSSATSSSNAAASKSGFQRSHDHPNFALSVFGNRRLQSKSATDDADEVTEGVPVEAFVVPLRNIAADNDNLILRACVHASERTKKADLCMAPVPLSLIRFKWESFAESYYVGQFIRYTLLLVAFATNSIVFEEWVQSASGQDRMSAWFLQGLIAAAAVVYWAKQLARGARSALRMVRGDDDKSLPSPSLYGFAEHHISLRTFTAFSGAAVWGLLNIGAYTLILAIFILRFLSDNGVSFLALKLEAVCSVIMWVKLLYFTRGFRATGPLTRMVIAVSVDIGWFLVILFTFVLGFAQAFFVISKRDHSVDFHSPIISVLSTFRLMFVDFDDRELMKHTHSPVLSWILFVGFLVATSVVLLNLLISILTDSYEKVQSNALGEWRLEQARLIIEIESRLSSSLRADSDLFPVWLHTLKPHTDMVTAVDEWSGRIKAITQNVSDRIEEAERALRTRIVDLESDVSALQSSTDHMARSLKNRLVNMEKHIGAPHILDPQLASAVAAADSVVHLRLRRASMLQKRRSMQVRR